MPGEANESSAMDLCAAEYNRSNSTKDYNTHKPAGMLSRTSIRNQGKAK